LEANEAIQIIVVFHSFLGALAKASKLAYVLDASFHGSLSGF
jgi:hypothetical protein